MNLRRFAPGACLGVVVVGLAAWAIARVLFSTPIAIGAHGYDLLVAARQPGLNPLLCALAGAGWITGNPVFTLKIVTLLVGVALPLAAYLLVSRIYRRPWLGVTAAALVAFGPAHVFLWAEMLPTLAAAVGLLLTAWLWADGGPISRIAAYVLGSLSVLCSPIVALPFALVLAAAFIYQKESTRIWAVGAFLLATVVWFAPAFLARILGPDAPLSLAGMLSPWPDWPLGVPAGLWGKALLVALAFLCLLLMRRTAPRTDTAWLAAVALAALALLANPFVDFAAPYSSWPGQLDALTGVAIALLGAGVVGTFSPKRLWVAGPGLILAAYLAALGPAPSGISSSFLRTRELLVTALQARRNQVPANASLIAFDGDATPAQFVLGVPVSSTPPSGPDPHVLWLVHGLPSALASSHSIFLYLDPDNTATALIPDADLRTGLARISDAQGLRVRSRNPNLALPVVESMNRER